MANDVPYDEGRLTYHESWMIFEEINTKDICSKQANENKYILTLIHYKMYFFTEFREAFNKYDGDRTGTLHIGEIGFLLKDLGYQGSFTRAKKTVEKADADGNIYIYIYIYLSLSLSLSLF